MAVLVTGDDNVIESVPAQLAALDEDSDASGGPEGVRREAQSPAKGIPCLW